MKAKEIALIGLGILFGLTGCGDGRSEQTKYDQAEINRKMSLYSNIQGVYEGTLEYANGDSTEVTLKVSALKLATGQKDSTGQSRFDAVIKAIYQQSDRFEDLLLAANYDEQSGLVSFSNENPNDTNEVISLTTRMDGGVVNKAQVFRRDGFVGYLSLKRTSLEVTAPAEGERNNRLDRIRQQLREVAGDYNMVITPVDQNTAAFSSRLQVLVDPITGLSLMAIYDRGVGLASVTMSANYSPENKTKEFKAKNDQASYYILGKLENGQLTGTMQLGATMATFVAKKK